jgi:hypothetical protein
MSQLSIVIWQITTGMSWTNGSPDRVLCVTLGAHGVRLRRFIGKSVGRSGWGARRACSPCPCPRQHRAESVRPYPADRTIGAPLVGPPLVGPHSGWGASGWGARRAPLPSGTSRQIHRAVNGEVVVPRSPSGNNHTGFCKRKYSHEIW